MDLLTLAAKITLDDKSYVNGLREAEGLGSQFANKMSATTVALGNLIAQVAMKAAGALKDMFSSALDGYSDYEQLIGGVETLFKSSSDKVSAYARQAFKTAGLSANEYMETVTGFSASLLQGLQGDTEAAAELANLAIMDMADNANKMGTDLSSIQNAYQGFAKQNYTMLDNLKLGYGGTASEMLRLVNDSGILDHEISSLDEITFDQLILAIHEVQTALGITGTTEEEASGTIAGSFRAMKAAWDDLLTSIGGQQGQERMNEAIENFKTAFSTYVSNIAPVIAGIIGNSGSLVGAIIDAITDLPNTALSDSFTKRQPHPRPLVQGASYRFQAVQRAEHPLECVHQYPCIFWATSKSLQLQQVLLLPHQHRLHR